MPRGYLSARINARNLLHHLWLNNGTWWCYYTLHWKHRKRRIKRSLKTPDVLDAIARRDELLARLASDGEDVPERKPRDDQERFMRATVA